MPAKPKKLPNVNDAGRIVERLRKWGWSYEKIALGAYVSVNTVIRWKKGVRPQPPHMRALQSVFDAEQRKRAAA